MKTVGIVAEYNPFHNGHKYHVQQTQKQLQADCVVAIMSGNFTQRGDVALFDMYKRAEIATKNGVDLVLSIPPQFVLNSAQFYAYYSIYILTMMGNIDYLSFGSECGDIEILKDAIKNLDVHYFKNEMKKGNTYAKSISGSELLKSPNNTLGIEYIKAIQKQKSTIQPFTIKRNKVEHNSQIINNDFASASYIRQLIKEKRAYANFLPNYEDYTLLTPKFEDKIAGLLSYKLNLGGEFENNNNISEGLENRILKAKDQKSMEEMIDKIKCKRYTQTRIRRALYSILLDITPNTEPPTYTRILAMTKTGQKYINSIKKTTKIKLFSRITKKIYMILHN